MQSKVCSKCDERKPLSDFYAMKGMKDGFRNECKVCHLAAAKARYEANPRPAIERVQRWQAENPERVRATRKRHNAKPDVKRRSRDAYYQRTYGITAEQFDRRLADQAGRCSICKAIPKRVAQMHVDHCHETGVIRGILCSSCNQGLGQFREDPSVLLRAAVYLRDHESPLENHGGDAA